MRSSSQERRKREGKDAKVRQHFHPRKHMLIALWCVLLKAVQLWCFLEIFVDQHKEFEARLLLRAEEVLSVRVPGLEVAEKVAEDRRFIPVTSGEDEAGCEWRAHVGSWPTVSCSSPAL